MKFWHAVSRLLRTLPPADRQFIENVWVSLSRIAGQLWFEAQNAMSSISPDHIPIYAQQYWRKFKEPWDLEPEAYSIPKLQDLVFSDNPREYIEGTDYTLSGNKIVWTVLGPTDGDMELAGVANWTQIGSPSTFVKDTTEQYAGVRCLKIGGVSGDGVESGQIAVTAEDWIRFTVYAKCDVNYRIEVWDKTNGVKIGDLTTLSGSIYEQRALGVKIPTDCGSAALRAILEGAGTLYLDNMELSRYPEGGVAFAEQTLRYNSYLDTKLGYDLRFSGINSSGYTPIHAHHMIRALNYAYRSSDAKSVAFKGGLSAILGLPFAYSAGIVKSKSTSGSKYIFIITDSSGVDHTMEIDSSLCALSDLPNVGASVEEFQPLIGDALKINELGGDGFIPQTDMNYPTDGDMEAAGTANWTAINGAVLAKDTNEQYEGSQCLKVTTDAVDEGVKPAADQSVTAGKEYVFEFQIKRGSGDSTIIRADVVDVTGAATITSEWFGDSSYERGFIRFTAPAGCSSVRVEFVVIKYGVFYVDMITFKHIEKIESYWADKIANSVKASHTIPASSRAGTQDLVFKAADHIYGENGNYIDVTIVASGANQDLSSTISGDGTAANHYDYVITTGNADASQNSNNAICAFTNSDPNAIGIIVCESADDNTPDPTFSLSKTSLSGGVNAKIGTYPDVPYVVGDIIDVRNLTGGTRETRKITAVTSGSAPYTKEISIDADLYAEYTSPETGTSTGVGSGYLEDTSKSWTTDEHKGDMLIDSTDTSFKINSNDAAKVYVTGTPAAGSYRIVKDHVVVIYGNRDSNYINQVTIYNRWTTTYSQDNVDAFVSNATDAGHVLMFKDIS